MGEARRKKQESARLSLERRQRLHRFALPGGIVILGAAALGLAIVPYSRAATADSTQARAASDEASPQEVAGPEALPKPTDLVQVYEGGRAGWRTIPCREVQHGQQFLFQGYLLQSHPQLGALQLVEGITESKLRDTLKDYDRATRRSPEADDAVQVIGTGQGRREFALLRDVTPGQRVVFQSAVYETALDGDYLAVRFTGDVFKRVTQTFEHPAGTIIDLHVRSDAGVEQVISGTPEHPFFVPAVNDYVPMGRLTSGTVLKTSDGSLATVTSSSRRQGDFTVYNFEVEDTHNYYVAGADGAPAVLVHNTCGYAPEGGRGYVTSGRNRPRWGNAPETGGLKGHAAKHSELSPREYYAEAVENMNQGYGVKYRHGGQEKMGYLRRVGEDEFMFTGTSAGGATPTIFTHLNVNTQYLRNIGITLPKGF